VAQPKREIVDLKRAFKEIEAKSELGTIEFLNFLLQRHPPSCGVEELRIKMREGGKMRKVILRFIQQYHPDKQAEQGNSLFEEITKVLNRFLGDNKD